MNKVTNEGGTPMCGIAEKYLKIRNNVIKVNFLIFLNGFPLPKQCATLQKNFIATICIS